ncbi:MAG: hypothetical protein ACRCYC_10285 [Paraclostridium sp.]|uniref:hypothetical protein n=1 Tax=Paraclostridium sp. TaxID=2023273 RepID=UPI003F2AADB7
MRKMKIGIYILSLLSLGVLSVNLVPDLLEKSDKIEITTEKGNLASLGNNELLFNFYQGTITRPIGMIQDGKYIQKSERTDSINDVYTLNNSGIYLSKEFQKTHKDLVNTFVKLLNSNSILNKQFKSPTIWGLDTEFPFITSTTTEYSSNSYEKDFLEIYRYDKDKNVVKDTLKLKDLNINLYDFNSLFDAKLKGNILSTIGVNFNEGYSSLSYKQLDLTIGKIICDKSFDLTYIDKYPVAWIGDNYIYTFVAENSNEKEEETLISRFYKINLNTFEKELLLETDCANYSIDNLNNILNIFSKTDDNKTNLYNINLDNDSVKEYNNLPFNSLEVSSYDDQISTYMINGNKLVVLSDITDKLTYKSKVKVINLNNNTIESEISVNNHMSIKRIAK